MRARPARSRSLPAREMPPDRPPGSDVHDAVRPALHAARRRRRGLDLVPAQRHAPGIPREHNRALALGGHGDGERRERLDRLACLGADRKTELDLDRSLPGVGVDDPEDRRRPRHNDRRAVQRGNPPGRHVHDAARRSDLGAAVGHDEPPVVAALLHGRRAGGAKRAVRARRQVERPAGAARHLAPRRVGEDELGGDRGTAAPRVLKVGAHGHLGAWQHLAAFTGRIDQRHDLRGRVGQAKQQTVVQRRVTRLGVVDEREDLHLGELGGLLVPQLDRAELRWNGPRGVGRGRPGGCDGVTQQGDAVRVGRDARLSDRPWALALDGETLDLGARRQRERHQR